MRLPACSFRSLPKNTYIVGNDTISSVQGSGVERMMLFHSPYLIAIEIVRKKIDRLFILIIIITQSDGDFDSFEQLENVENVENVRILRPIPKIYFARETVGEKFVHHDI